jgi:hypothetical protein
VPIYEYAVEPTGRPQPLGDGGVIGENTVANGGDNFIA